MKKKWLCIMALTGICVLSACGNRETNDVANSNATSNVADDVSSGEADKEKLQVSDDINAFNKKAAFGEFTDVLVGIKDNIKAGVSGSSLTIVSETVDLLNVSVGTELTEEEIKNATKEWYDGLDKEEQELFKENIQLVDKTYKELLEDGKEELLASAGRSDAPYPWTENGEVIGKVEVIMEIMGLR